MPDELVLTKAQAAAFLRFMQSDLEARQRLYLEPDGHVFATDGHRLLLWRTGLDLPQAWVERPVLEAAERLATVDFEISIREDSSEPSGLVISCGLFSAERFTLDRPEHYPDGWRKLLGIHDEPGTTGTVACNPRLFAEVQALFDAIGLPHPYCEMRLGPCRDGAFDPIRFDAGDWTALVMPMLLQEQ